MKREQIISEIFEVFVRIGKNTFKAKIGKAWRYFTAEEVDLIIEEYAGILTNKKSA